MKITRQKRCLIKNLYLNLAIISNADNLSPLALIPTSENKKRNSLSLSHHRVRKDQIIVYWKYCKGILHERQSAAICSIIKPHTRPDGKRFDRKHTPPCIFKDPMKPCGRLAFLPDTPLKSLKSAALRRILKPLATHRSTHAGTAPHQQVVQQRTAGAG